MSPEREGTRQADFWDYILIMICFPLRLALTPIFTLIMNVIVYATLHVINFSASPSAYSIALFNSEVRNLSWIINLVKWIVIHSIFLAHWVFCILQMPFQFLNVVYSTLVFWPKFYWTLLGPYSDGRSIWAILCNPGGDSSPSKRAKEYFDEQEKLASCYISLRPTNAKFNVFTSYQVDGAHAHLASRLNSQVRDGLLSAIDSATVFPYFDDPFRLSVAYAYVAKHIKEPPDCLLQYLWAMFWHFFWAFSYVTMGYCRLQYRWACAYLARMFGKEPPSSSKSTKDPVLVVHCFASDADTPKMNLISFDTDGIPFIVDSGANCIISNVRALFKDLKPVRTAVRTASGEDTRQRYQGTFLLQLPDDSGKIHNYEIPDCVYDPHSNYNILGVSKLSNFFGDNSTSSDPRDKDGTKADSGGTRTHLVWDHRRHELHFLHRSREEGLPVLHLYKGSTKFQVFCSTLSRIYDGAVHYAFSSAYSVAPESGVASANEGDDMATDDEEDKWYDPSLCAPCSPSTAQETKFKLGESLLYAKFTRSKKNKKKLDVTTISVVYEGVNADGKTHIVRMKDGTKMAVHDSYLQKHLQPSFDNIPQTPLDYKNEVGTGISQEEAQRLARPTILSPAQQELLSWHHRLYHLNFKRLFTLARLGVLPKNLLECESTVPLCLECQFGKAHRRPWTSKGKHYGSIQKKSETKPGDGVSVDQIVSAQPGLVPQMSGFLTHERIWGATTFVDHVTDYVYVHLMKNFTIEETLSAKKAFEKIFAAAEHDVKSYRADNGRFADKKWQESCDRLDQKVTFCGVGNHRQNGKIEAKNKQLTLAARTLLLHGMRLWPEMISTYFWPFAMKAAAESHNRLSVDIDGNTPESRLYGVKQPQSIPIKSFHTLFCPVYVLDHRLHAAGGSIPKWEPRARCGVYLGHSPIHAGNVALVFNPVTGRVSPAYHVVFDDTFSTVPYMRASSLPPNWEELVKNSTEIATTEDFELADVWTKELDIGTSKSHMPTAGPQIQNSSSRVTDPFAIVPDQSAQDSEFSPVHAPSPSEPAVQPSEGERNKSSSSTKKVSFEDKKTAASPSPKRTKLNNETSAGTSHQISPAAKEAQPDADAYSMPPIINLEEAGLRRSARIAEKQLNDKKTSDGVKVFAVTLFTALSTVGSITLPDYCSNRDENELGKFSWADRCMTRFHEVNELYDGTCNQIHFMAFSTQSDEVASNEVFTYAQAMKQHDVEDFKNAMEKEIDDHTKREHWVIVPRSSMPKGKKAIMSIWSFKRKRLPSGELLKHKARLCAHGGMQKWGENYWETYSPVVNMLTVRLLLIICKIHKLHSKSIDFVLAFPQADLEEDIWMEIPLGVDIISEDGGSYVLKLRKNLYGLKQGSHNWFKHLQKGLQKRGLKSSEVDPCLYWMKGLTVLTYVDDCILVSTSKQTIDDFVESLKNGEEKFQLTDEGDIDKFLGIEIKHFEDGSFEISQPHLITRILQLLRLDQNNEWKSSTNSRRIPSDKTILHRDSEGELRKYADHWNYRTAVGMLTYLQGNSRPDISVHVHQCARFSIDPKRSHERAIIGIGRYLLTSRDRGIIYKPDTSKGLECYVDADFAGGWQKADAESADSVMSRTGYVLMYAGCPIHWVSKLQTEIALSTAEAEYIALSQSLREVIPLMSMMKELKATFPIEIEIPNFNCTVHEDNQSCISMATKQKFSPRTKHIALKYHHFRSFVDSKKIEVQYINTQDQLADCLTKPLGANLFFDLRKMLMGW